MTAPQRADLPRRGLSGGARGALVDHRWLGVPILGAVLSRGWSLLLLGTAAVREHLQLFGPSAITVKWDAAWYLRIAADGYHRAPFRANLLHSYHDYAFFPLWPGLIRAASWTGLDAAIVAPVLSAVLFCVAAGLIAAALAPTFGRAAATDGALLLAFSPAAWTFSMGYSEALFLVFAAAAFLTTSPGVRAVAVAFAVIARISGLPLIAVDGLRFLRSRGRDWGALAVAMVGALAFAGWWIAVALISGNPLGFLQGSPEWGHVTGIWQVLHVLVHPDPARLAALAVVLVVTVGAVVAFRRSWALGTFALLTLGLGLLPGGLVSSMPRYALAAFPAYAGLASIGGRRGAAVLIVLSALAQIAFVAFSFPGPHRGIAP